MRGRKLRLQLQGLLVGIQRGFQLAALGQGVATIVVGAGVVAFGKALSGSGVVAGLVQRHPLPLRVLEMLRRLAGPLLLQQALALLVGAQPQVVELEGVAGLRHG